MSDADRYEMDKRVLSTMSALHPLFTHDWFTVADLDEAIAKEQRRQRENHDPGDEDRS